jgi:uncharacterized protein YjbI with pentapeptide repeats
LYAADANLSVAGLSRVAMFVTDMPGADLFDAILMGADLTDADLNGAVMPDRWEPQKKA